MGVEKKVLLRCGDNKGLGYPSLPTVVPRLTYTHFFSVFFTPQPPWMAASRKYLGFEVLVPCHSISTAPGEGSRVILGCFL